MAVKSSDGSLQHNPPEMPPAIHERASKAQKQEREQKQQKEREQQARRLALRQASALPSEEGARCMPIHFHSFVGYLPVATRL